MKLTVFVASFLTVAVQANNPQNAVQLAASAQDDQENVVFATPAPTTFTDVPTPAPTDFSGSTSAFTAAWTESTNFTITTTSSNSDDATLSTESANFTITTTSSNSDDATQSTRPAGIVGVAYSTEGTVGVAYATTRAEYEAEKSASNNSGSSATVPIVIIGCLVGVLGVVAAAVAMKKRKAVAGEDEEEKEEGANAIHTPVGAKTKYSQAIDTPDMAECEMDRFDDINTHTV